MRCMKFLNTLCAYGNNLHGLHAQLDILAQMRHLKNLDLYGNPLAEETDYRLHVIKRLKTLEVFDRHVVTDEEREAAAVLGTHRAKKQDTLAEPKVYVPEMSGTVKMMMADVTKLKREQAEREEAERKKMFQLEETDGIAVSAFQDPPQAYQSGSILGEFELDHWERYNLSDIFDSFDQDKNGHLSRKELRAVLTEFEDCGRVIDHPLTSTDIESTLCAMFDAIDTNGDDKISKKEFMEAATVGCSDKNGNELPPINWKPLTAEQALERSEELFDEAKEHQMRSLGMEPDHPKYAEVVQHAKQCSMRANKLEALHKNLTARVRQVKPQAAKPRSDTINVFSYASRPRQGDTDGDDSSDDDEEAKGTLDQATFDRRKRLGLTGKDFSKFRKDKRNAQPQKVYRSDLVI